mmetsp:Transcript_3498/g.9748  ORF Transcript_3498/g.9748 Transcript_3498/m.9748 type:complete len:248 (-) Transcript_3498:792-1535(-)
MWAASDGSGAFSTRFISWNDERLLDQASLPASETAAANSCAKATGTASHERGHQCSSPVAEDLRQQPTLAKRQAARQRASSARRAGCAPLKQGANKLLPERVCGEGNNSFQGGSTAKQRAARAVTASGNAAQLAVHTSRRTCQRTYPSPRALWQRLTARTCRARSVQRRGARMAGTRSSPAPAPPRGRARRCRRSPARPRCRGDHEEQSPRGWSAARPCGRPWSTCPRAGPSPRCSKALCAPRRRHP